MLEVTQEMYDWLSENGYGKEEKKVKKTQKNKASDKEQEINEL